MTSVRIPLRSTKHPGKYAVVDREDLPLIQGLSWYPCRDGERWYAMTTVRGEDGKWTNVTMHCHLVGPHDGMEIDHWDLDGLNNRRNNLRVCTKSQNQGNRRCNRTNRTGLKGVHARGNGRYQARISGTSGSLVGLGTYGTPEAAARAYDAAAREKYGEFARCNFPITLEGDE